MTQAAGQPVWQELPLFPLGTLLYPQGCLPLQIFEVRYLDMIQRCYREQQAFGVVHLLRGHEVDRPGAPELPATEQFAQVGTAAQILELQRPQPGLLFIRTRGGRRFRIHHAEKRRYGLWVAQVEWLPEAPAVEVPDELQHLVESLRGVLAQIRKRYPEAFPFQDDDPGWSDAGWVAHRWCEILPESNTVKQRLLETDSPLLRLELVGDLVDRLPRVSIDPS